MANALKYGLNYYQSNEDAPFSGFNSGDVFSKSFGGELGQAAGLNNEIGTSFAESAIGGYGKWRQAKDMADAYKRQIDVQRNASKKKDIWGSLLGFAGAAANLVPGGQLIGLGLGAAGKAFG